MRFFITIQEISAIATPYPPTRLINDSNLNEHKGVIFSHNRSYHCPQCGRVWAEWRKEDDLTYEWYPVRRSCENHAHGWWNGDNPGSLITDYYDLMVLPGELLQRELLLLLEKGTR